MAHLGPVQFSPDADWVGVRLTGPSLGMGRNDGSVQGVRYFDCGRDANTTSGGSGGGGGERTKNGMFVKKTAVKRRELSRLEELRLKRELRGAGGTGGSASSSGVGVLVLVLLVPVVARRQQGPPGPGGVP